MQLTRRSIQTGRQPRASPATRRCVVSVCASQRCTAADAGVPCRRDVLLGVGAALVAPLVITNPASAGEGTATYKVRYLPVKDLGTFQRGDQKEEFRRRAEAAVKKFLGPSDSPACLRLALYNAGNYDEATKTGGANGAIINASLDGDLKALVGKLKQVKAEIEATDKNGAGPISWADLIYLSGKVTTQQSWDEIKINKAEIRSGGETIVSQFGNPWPTVLGRVDSDVLGPNKVPGYDASVEEIRDYLLKLGAKPAGGPFSPKPPFWEKPGFLIWTAAAPDAEAEEKRFAAASSTFADIKKGYDISRRTVTRTNYEVDFSDAYNKLNNLGAKFNRDAYLYPQPIFGGP